MDPAPAGAYGTLVQNSTDGTVSRDPIRDELREILLPCQHDIDNLRDLRVSGRRRRRLLMVFAALVHTATLSRTNRRDLSNPAYDPALEAIIADRQSGGPECTGGTLARTCGMAPEQAYGLEYGGPRDDEAGPRVLPERSIDGALEAIDEALWSRHEPANWGDEERASYEASINDLSRLCAELRTETD